MNYYENAEAYEARGIDYDLDACLQENPQKTFTVTDIERVLAVWEGENDDDDWRWVLRLNDGRFVFLQGGCDYTGWDCQSWASHSFADSAEAAAEKALGDVPTTAEQQPSNAGLGHMLTMLGGTYGDNFTAVRDALLDQIRGGKRKTRHEIVGEQMKTGQ